ncbi:MAG: hypothetical protein K1X53_02050 [Candidatus Sumerlaeaceae bacterium]|nr:hypothetical protein [Candidatus Sumerlaeaceae bacterium]
MHRVYLVTVALLILGVASPAAPPSAPIDLMADTWSATDAYGRSLPMGGEVRAPQPNKTVGMFYFLWHEPPAKGGGGRAVYDISKLLTLNPANPAWGPVHAFHHWGESELGYYTLDDDYVIRRHAQLLSEAGVDVLILDATNAFTYTPMYMNLCQVLAKMRSEGLQTPQIAFIVYNGDWAGTVRRIHSELYAKNLYPELWFRWKGKPLILAPLKGFPPELAPFFSIRESWAWNQAPWFGDGKDRWPWLDHWPQKFGWHEDPKRPEEVAVCVAQHPNSNIGRSFHSKRQPPPGKEQTTAGLCFEEQWKRALAIDPEFVFVTGWNEWIAQRFVSANGGDHFLGKTLPPGGTFFVDLYNQEFSRDLEPMRGGHGDAYYYQLVDNVRRYKGARPVPVAGAPAAINMDGRFEDWKAVTPEFRDAPGDTVHRDHGGWAPGLRYVDNSGRNDIILSKVAHDNKTVSFYAQTRAPLTPISGPNWMVLFIDADANAATGWHGYEYRLNARVAGPTTTSLEQWVPASANKPGAWSPPGQIAYSAAGNELEISVPRVLPGLTPAAPLRFDFHWADNPTSLDDYDALITSGDNAPNRRFNYRFIGK